MKQPNMFANPSLIVAEMNLIFHPSPRTSNSVAPWKLLLGQIRINDFCLGWLGGAGRPLGEAQMMGANEGILWIEQG